RCVDIETLHLVWSSRIAELRARHHLCAKRIRYGNRNTYAQSSPRTAKLAKRRRSPRTARLAKLAAGIAGVTTVRTLAGSCIVVVTVAAKGTRLVRLTPFPNRR